MSRGHSRFSSLLFLHPFCNSFQGGRPSIGRHARRTNCATRFLRLRYITILTPRLQCQCSAEANRWGKVPSRFPMKMELKILPCPPLKPNSFARGKKKARPLQLACMQPNIHPIFETQFLQSTLPQIRRSPGSALVLPTKPPALPTPSGNTKITLPRSCLVCGLSRTVWGARGFPACVRRRTKQAVEGAPPQRTRVRLLGTTTDYH